MFVGKQFASPTKQGSLAKCAKDRDDLRVLCYTSISSDIMSTSTELEATVRPELQIVVIGQQLETNYSVHELTLVMNLPIIRPVVVV